MTLYEYPLNERIRTLLRLENLFDKLRFFAQPGDARLHQVAVTTLFDVLELTERSDLKGALLQDIDRQRATLAALAHHPDVAQDRLAVTLQQLEDAAARLAAQGRTGQTLRDHEWLASLRGRVNMPGGATQMDAPSYYAWQMRDAPARCADLQAWMAPFVPLYDCLTLVLGLLRQSGVQQEEEAAEGCYQQMLAGKAYQLLRVWVSAREDATAGLFPEISANKYMVWIRFATQCQTGKPQPAACDVPFQLALCN